MIAANSVPSGVSCVPPPCGRTFDGGISGSAISHSPSGTIQLHLPRPMFGRTSKTHTEHGLSACSAYVRRSYSSVTRPVQSPSL